MKPFYMHLYLTISLFTSLTVQTIILPNKTNTYCSNLGTNLNNLFGNCYKNKKIENCHDGINPQSCSLRNVNKDRLCCYISVKFNSTWYNFCGNIDENIRVNNTFIEEAKKKYMINYTSDYTLKVDCFRKKLNYMWFISFITFILFI